MFFVMVVFVWVLIWICSYLPWFGITLISPSRRVYKRVAYVNHSHDCLFRKRTFVWFEGVALAEKIRENARLKEGDVLPVRVYHLGGKELLAEIELKR